VYAKFATQHGHPAGPWQQILAAVQARVSQGGQAAAILDLASGLGRLPLLLANALPSAHVTCSDNSIEMVRKAAKLARRTVNLDALHLDMHDLSPMADASIDVVTCCFGLALAEDRPKALLETLRVLRPGGAFIATAWVHNAAMLLAGDILHEVTGCPPLLGPMPLSKPEEFERAAAGAGFVEVASTIGSYPFDFGEAKEIQLAMGTLPVWDVIQELGMHGAAEKAFWANIDRYAVVENGRMFVPGNIFTLVTARKPV